MTCVLCPRRCGIDRSQMQGPCHAGEALRVAAILAHKGEEPPLVTGAGSGAIFFSGCPLVCAYCQNKQISHTGLGYTIPVDVLAVYMLKLQAMGCANINLISPTHFTPALIDALSQARQMGLCIPVMLNSSGYERRETLERLRPHIQIYLVDVKYGDNQTGRMLSKVKDYWDRARDAVAWIWNFAGPLEMDDRGTAIEGLIIRHLVLPGMLSNPLAVLEFLSAISTKVPVSVMSQYNPVFYYGHIREMQRKLSPEEYQVVLKRAVDLGFETIFAQEIESTQTYVPDFSKASPFGDEYNLLMQPEHN